MKKIICLLAALALLLSRPAARASRPQMQPAAMRFPTLSLALFHRNRKSYYQVFIFYSQSPFVSSDKYSRNGCTAKDFVLY